MNSLATTPDGSVLVVGTRTLDAGQTSSDRDGFIARLRGPAASASFVGGPLNDQLFGVATNANDSLAVGLTRSFLGSAAEDQTLLVWGPLRDGGEVVDRLFNPGGIAVQARVVATAGINWVIGGYWGPASRGFVAQVSSAHQVLEAMSFDFGAGTSNYTMRAMASDGVTVAAVGAYEQGGTQFGYLAAFSATTLGFVFARRWGGTTNSSLLDVVVDGNEITAVGNEGSSGILLRVDATGALLSAAVVPGTRLRGIESSRLVTGVESMGYVVARVGPGSLEGVRFANLTWPSGFGAQPLVSSPAGPRAFGIVGTELVDMPLNLDLFGNCGGTQTGQRFTASVLQGPSPVALAMLRSTESVTIAPVAAVTTPVAARVSATCP